MEFVNIDCTFFIFVGCCYGLYKISVANVTLKSINKTEEEVWFWFDFLVFSFWVSGHIALKLSNAEVKLNKSKDIKA